MMHRRKGRKLIGLMTTMPLAIVSENYMHIYIYIYIDMYVYIGTSYLLTLIEYTSDHGGILFVLAQTE
jgi:hypothetical protein